MSDRPNLHDIVKVHVATELDNHFDLYPDVSEDNISAIVTNTLDTMQAHYYLVPKKQIAEDGGLVKRDVPVDAIEDSISAFWNNVSN